MRKLFASEIGFSSVVGGGLALNDAEGRTVFQVAFMGTTQGITKQESTELAKQFARFVNENGLEISDRPQEDS